MVGELVTIASYRDLPEALLAQGKLRSAGIESVLADDNIVRLDWLWANAVGGIKLRVREEEVADAVELLEEPIPDSFSPEQVGEDYPQPQCPHCESLDVTFENAARRYTFLSWLLLGIPLPFGRKERWRCGHCGYEWSELSERQLFGD